MFSRIQEARQRKQKLFCAFLTLGYPNLSVTEKLIGAFEKLGVDIIELGFPFSDPLADGPTIQASSEAALKKGVKLEDAFHMAGRLRKKGVKVPLLFFTYFNPVFHYGTGEFVSRAKRAGFDGTIIPDLPPDEESAFQATCRKKDFAQIFLIAPTTSRARAAKIARKSQGFIYYVSLKGVTGARKALPRDLTKQLKQLRQMTSKPFLVGFGVSSPGQAKALLRMSDGIIVGSALIERLRRSNGNPSEALRFAKAMIRAVKGQTGPC
ncbi:MAG TPA: tryptophan synthase subunit alpha [bacterium]|nr:tryptophan synthase subunit alpha [bacterium]